MNATKLALFGLVLGAFSGVSAKEEVALSRIINKTPNAVKIEVKKLNGEVIKSADALAKGSDLGLPVTTDKIGSVVVDGKTVLQSCYPPFTRNKMSFSNENDKKSIGFYNILELVADEKGNLELNCSLEIFVG